jgi:DNA-binding CsgD family transcriptional regulator
MRLQPDQQADIRRLYLAGWRGTEIAARIGCARRTIWEHTRDLHRLSWTQQRQLDALALRRGGKSLDWIAEYLGFDNGKAVSDRLWRLDRQKWYQAYMTRMGVAG